MNKIEYVTVHVDDIRRVTQKAVLVTLSDNEMDVWIPRTCLSKKTDDLLESAAPNQTELKVAKWFADEKEINY